MNTLILFCLAVALAFVLGAWSWIIISSKSPQIYEIKPLLGEIFSDLLNLTRNFKKLFYLTSEVTQGILTSSVNNAGDNPKLFKAVVIEDLKQANKKGQSDKSEKSKDDAFDEDSENVNSLRQQNKSIPWFGKFFVGREKSIQEDVVIAEPPEDVVTSEPPEDVVTSEPPEDVGISEPPEDGMQKI